MLPRPEATLTTPAPQRPRPDTVPPGTAYVCPISHIPEAVRTLRHRAHALLTRWGLSHDAVDDAVLVISELATNAIDHALPPAELRLSMPEADGRRVLRIEVSDRGPAPRPSSFPDRPDPDENGRGLSIVAALSLRHGTYLASGRATQWADLPAPPHNARPAAPGAKGAGV
ncbi:ATP-binding protein [Streptomyces phyllanthi]|uniref:ATP-binding protein n=1 Tax=Streptomyces phyllanthi TaxID=1803180 RepID=A0A5N8W720_9ACTN|nr:ATP-binding protein [Streptomyces phyllanthi]MPY43089.1 ATP-binding protein [Streptomyces phyllanthi]